MNDIFSETNLSYNPKSDTKELEIQNSDNFNKI